MFPLVQRLGSAGFAGAEQDRGAVLRLDAPRARWVAAPARPVWSRRAVVSIILHAAAIAAVMPWLHRPALTPAPVVGAGVAMLFEPAPAAAPIATPAVAPVAAPTPPPIAPPVAPPPAPTVAPPTVPPPTVPPPALPAAAPPPPPAPSPVVALPLPPQPVPPPPPVRHLPAPAVPPARPAPPAATAAPARAHMGRRSAGAPAQPVPAAAAPAIAAGSGGPSRAAAVVATDRPPVYPEMARERGEQGRVIVRVTVTADGTPLTVSVATSSGHAALDAAALAAVRRWRFVPAERDGRRVATVVEIPIHFRLEE